MTTTTETPAGPFEVAAPAFADAPALAEPATWTLAWRKRTGPVFHRATDWSGTWEQAYQLARVLGDLHPELQVYYTSTAAYEADQAARIAAGEIGPEYAEDHGNIMVESGKRVKIRDNGKIDQQALSYYEQGERTATTLTHPTNDKVTVTVRQRGFKVWADTTKEFDGWSSTSTDIDDYSGTDDGLVALLAFDDKIKALRADGWR